MRMAAFKLREAAQRLKSLAREASAARTRSWLTALADHLFTREAQLWALIDPGRHEVSAGAGDREAARGRRPRRRAIG